MPHYRSDLTIRNSGYREYQRHLSKNCGRTFNDKTYTIFAHSELSLKEWYSTIYAFLRFNTSIRQIEAELDLPYRTVRRRVKRSGEALDAPSITLSRPVEIDEVYVSAGLKGRESDEPPMFTLVDCGSDDWYVVPAKSADEPTIRLLLADHDDESLTVYTDGFRAYEPLEEDDAFTREYVVHGDGEQADDDIHLNTCDSHPSLTRRWLSPRRGVSKDKLTPYLRGSQLRCELYRKPGDEALKHALNTTP